MGSLFFWHHMQCPLRVLLNHAAFEELWMMFYMQPGFNEIRIVLAGWMTGLSRRVSRQRRFQISQVHNLAIRRYSYYIVRLVSERSTHIDGIDITSKVIGAAIENSVEWPGHT